MKKIYKSPEIRVVGLKNVSILAGSLIDKADTQEVNLDTNEVLDGDNIEIF